MGFEVGFELRNSSNKRLTSHGGLSIGLGNCGNNMDNFIKRHAELNDVAYDCDDEVVDNDCYEYVISNAQLKAMVTELRPVYDALSNFSDRVLADIENYECGYDNISDKEYRRWIKDLDVLKDALYELDFETDEYLRVKSTTKAIYNLFELGILDDNKDLKLIYWRSW